jgi:hypothetical protein
MATSSTFPTVPRHLFTAFRFDAPLHALTWFIRFPCYLVKRFVQRQVMSNGVLVNVSRIHKN